MGFLFYYVRSLVMSVQFSLSEVSLSDNGYQLNFIGFSNFVAAFNREVLFPQVLVQSFLNMFVDVAMILFFSLFLAVMLNAKFKGRSLARSIFFLPVVLNSSAISGALSGARALMAGGGGAAPQAAAQAVRQVFNAAYYLRLFSQLGIPLVAVDYLIGAVSRIADIITSSGVQIVIFIAALQAISPAMFEVAKIEGATAYESFWKITFPMVSPLIITNFVYTAVDAYIKSPVVQLSFDTIFGYRNEYAMGTVFSIVSLLIICLFLLLSTSLMSKMSYYQN
jgi:ABC-type sugar transport system permease subunit